MSSSSGPARVARPLLPTWPRPGWTSCCWRSPRFPREKVCGDGLTPRAVKELIALGIPTREEDGWIKNQGLRVIGGGVRLQLKWPELASLPGLRAGPAAAGLRRGLVRHAEKVGARLHERTSVTGPVLDERTGRVLGVTAREVDDQGKASGPSAPSAPRWSSPPTATPAGSRSRSA